MLAFCICCFYVAACMLVMLESIYSVSSVSSTNVVVELINSILLLVNVFIHYVMLIRMLPWVHKSLLGLISHLGMITDQW